MYLEKISLTNFKNYPAQELTFAPDLNCFVGMNGMGKTNLLDAIYYLTMGKSHFGLPDFNVVRHGESFFRLEGLFIREGTRERVTAKVQPRRKKELELNGVPYQRLSDHVGFIPVVFIAPDDTYLVQEGSEARRSFLDNTLSQLDREYLQQLILYHKVLRQRNAALRQFAESRTYDPALIEAYDRQLAPSGIYLHNRRQSFLEQFRPLLRETASTLSGRREQMDCTYRSKLTDSDFARLLKEAAEKDRYLERTTIGIHKDDLEFSIGGHPLKKFGSQGQLKSFILALKLAQYEMLKREKGQPPLLLLDDIFDKLDHRRVEMLLKLLLSQSFGQVFVTDTDERRLNDIIRQMETEYRIFKIENGRAAPA